MIFGISAHQGYCAIDSWFKNVSVTATMNSLMSLTQLILHGLTKHPLGSFISLKNKTCTVHGGGKCVPMREKGCVIWVTPPGQSALKSKMVSPNRHCVPVFFFLYAILVWAVDLISKDANTHEKRVEEMFWSNRALLSLPKMP